MRLTARLLTAFMMTAAVSAASATGVGMVQVKSAHDVAMTADRLEKVLGEKGMKVFARIDHAAGAVSVGQELRPTTLVLFGNPKVGTGLMNCAQSAGIDLPMKALVWKDADGAVWLSYNSAEWLGERHGISESCAGVLGKVSKALAAFAAAATMP